MSSSYSEFQLPSISEAHSTPEVRPRGRSGSPEKRPVVGGAISNASTPEHQSTSASTSTTARSSRRDSLSDKPVSACTTVAANSFDGDLLKEFQRHKQRFQEETVSKDEIPKQICIDSRLQDGR